MNTRFRKLNFFKTPWVVVTLSLTLFFYACKNGKTPSPQQSFKRVVVDTNPPVTPLSPQESMKKIQLPPGYHIELVASEPMVQEPVAIAWDGNGRMYVAEMNTYMKDAAATGEYEPTSRIKCAGSNDFGRNRTCGAGSDSSVSRSSSSRTE